MDRVARATIARMRRRGYRVLFQCNYDASISVMAITSSGTAYIVKGRLSDDSRAIAELGKMVRLDEEAEGKGA
jgi:hypothetical protein